LSNTTPLKFEVFKLVRDGDSGAEQLRDLLSPVKPDMLKRIFNATDNGANALINAAQEGHTKIVEVLVWHSSILVQCFILTRSRIKQKIPGK
jgi:hypothetical protein